jgi:glycosyltransferase involved in cell wall biosynthesis
MSLDDVLVVTVEKSFWASPEARRFPHRVYARVFYGHSTNLLNSAVVFIRSLAVILLRRPRLVVLGSVERTVPWFIAARRLGLLGRAKLVVTNQLHLSDDQLRQVDRNIVYSQAWIDAQRPAVRTRAVFAYLPADGDLERARSEARPGEYVFAGGGNDRDFGSVIRAMQGTGVALEIVTFSRSTLGYDGELPPGCAVRWRMPLPEFLARLAGAKIVVVPLRAPDSDFGQTTLVQALALGKAVVATSSPSVVDYVDDGREGLLVEPGDVGGYRDAILRLLEDDVFRHHCERSALARAENLSFAAFGRKLNTICADLLDNDARTARGS